MNTYKFVVVEKELAEILILPTNPIPVSINFNVGEDIGHAKNFKLENCEITCDIEVNEPMFGYFPCLGYSQEAGERGVITHLGLTDLPNEDDTILRLKFSEEELNESNNDSKEDRYHS